MGILDAPDRVRDVPLLALASGLLAALIAAGFTGNEWWHVRGHPIESARVITMVPTGRQQHCGKGTQADVYAITWLSTSPPQGLPAQFESTEGCDAPQVGDVDTVVRVVDGNGTVHVWDDPTTSIGEVATVSGAVLGLVTALLATGFLIRIGWRRRRGVSGEPRHAEVSPGHGRHQR